MSKRLFSTLFVLVSLKSLGQSFILSSYDGNSTSGMYGTYSVPTSGATTHDGKPIFTKSSTFGFLTVETCVVNQIDVRWTAATQRWEMNMSGYSYVSGPCSLSYGDLLDADPIEEAPPCGYAFGGIISNNSTGCYTGCTAPDAPTPASTAINLCVGQDLTLISGCPSGETLRWYENAKYAGEGSPLVISGITSSKSYYARCSNGTCESRNSTKVTVTTEAVSTPINTSNSYSVCEGGSAELSSSCSSGVVRWYEDTQLMATGNSFITAPMTTNKSYYTKCYLSSCETEGPASTPISVTVTSIPSLPSSVSPSQNVCPGANVTLSASCDNGSSPAWYNALTDSYLYESTSYTAYNVSSTRSYYVRCHKNNCIGEKSTDIVLTVITSPPTPETDETKSVCGGSAATLTAECPAGFVVKWFSSSAGSTLLHTGNTYITPALTSATYYYAACSSDCGEGVREEITVLIDNSIPTEPGTEENYTVCLNNSLTVTANCSSGETKWYETSSSTTPFLTGEYNYTFTPTSNTILYISCATTCAESTKKTVSVNLTGTAPSPPIILNQAVEICNTSSYVEMIDWEAYPVIFEASCASGTPTWYFDSGDEWFFAQGNQALRTLPWSPGGYVYVSCNSDEGCNSEKLYLGVTGKSGYSLTETTNPSDGSKNFTAVGCTGSVTWDLGKRPPFSNNYYHPEENPYTLKNEYEVFTTYEGGTIPNIELNNNMYFVRYTCDNVHCTVIGQGCHAKTNGLISVTENFDNDNRIIAGAVNGATKRKIEATNHITGTSKIVYDAPSIELKPGFKTDSGTTFIARTRGGCMND